MLRRLLLNIHPHLNVSLHPTTASITEPQRFGPEESVRTSSGHRSAGGDFRFCPGHGTMAQQLMVEVSNPWYPQSYPFLGFSMK